MAPPHVRFQRLAVMLALAGMLAGPLSARDSGVALADTSPGTGGFSCPGSVGGRSLDGPTNVGTPGVMVQGNASNDFMVFCSYPKGSSNWAVEVAWTPIGSSSHTFEGCGSVPNNPEATWVSRDYWAYAGTNLDDPPPVLGKAARTALNDVKRLASPCLSPPAEPPAAKASPTTEAPTTEASPTEAVDIPSPSAVPPTIASDAASPALAGRPLCDEAIREFGDRLSQAGVPDPKITRLRTSGAEIKAGFTSVIATYNAAHPNAHAHTSIGTAGTTIGAVDWLWEVGGFTNKILDYVPVVGDSPTSSYVTNTERRLLAKIKRSTHPLSPAEVFSLALDLNKGDVSNALLAAHNTLRALGRTNGVNQKLTGVMPAPWVYGKHLANLRIGAENAGPWYHLFGTAYFELAHTATGKGAEAAQAAAFGSDSPPAGAPALGTAAAHFSAQLPQVSLLSGFANWAEQLVRASSKPDAEKYCVNVWGAQLGAELAQLVGGTASYAGSSFEFDGNASELDVLQSPFSVRWTTPQGTTTIDQKTGEVRFGNPLIVYPLAEADSWGAVFVPPAHTSGTVTFVATEPDADLHFLRVAAAGEQAVLYTATAGSVGDEMTLTLGDTAFGQPMTKSDGTLIAAQRLSMTVKGPATVGGVRAADVSPSVKLVAAVVAIVVLGVGCVGGALLLVRRRRAKST